MDFFEHSKREWQRLVRVCRRWRQIIYASPRYLDLLLYCSKGTFIRNLSCWPAFPITINYFSLDPEEEDDVVALLQHSDRVRKINLPVHLTDSQLRKVVLAMQEPFPLLTQLELHADLDLPDELDLPGGFLGGSAPCLREVGLDAIPFPELPTLLLSSCDLVSLHLNRIPPTDYISPEAMIASLSVLTKLQSLRITFQFWRSYPEQRTGHPVSPVRAVLPALTEFAFWGRKEYLEDFVARLDTPRLEDLWMFLDRLNSLWLPQLSLFIARTETLRFSHARLEFSGQTSRIELGRDFYPHGPRLILSAVFEWWGTHFEYMSHFLGQIFAMFSNVGHLYIRAGADHPDWQDDIDSVEWLTFFHLFTTIETLHISGSFAGQVARALEDVPEEMVTEVLPSLHLLVFEDIDGPVDSADQFVSLRQVNGHPVTVIDLEAIKLELLHVYRLMGLEKGS